LICMDGGPIKLCVTSGSGCERYPLRTTDPTESPGRSHPDYRIDNSDLSVARH
jgi:hypothetical protein